MGADLYTLSLYVMVGVLRVGFAATADPARREATRGAVRVGDARRGEPATTAERRLPMNESAARGAAARAIALWVVVSAGLLYGVVNTKRQVTHLYGGC